MLKIYKIRYISLEYSINKMYKGLFGNENNISGFKTQ